MSLNLGLSLIQNMKQELRMTPQLQLAIRHLQLSRVELIEEIQRELISNPLLEDANNQQDHDSLPMQEDAERGRRERRRGKTERDEESAGGENRDWGGVQNPQSLGNLDTAEGAHQARMEMDWDNYINDDTSRRREMDSVQISNEDYVSPLATYARSRTLDEHLLEQVRLSDFTHSEREIAILLVGNMDDKGYLKGVTAEEIAQELDLDLELVEEVIESMQQFDPVGVCARDIKECLLAQCKALQLNNLLRQLIDQHLTDVERNRLPLIAKKMGISITKVTSVVEELKRLDPCPGHQYSSDNITYVTPDVYVDWVDDELKVRVNDSGLPRLKVNRFYRDQLKTSNDSEGKKYVTERLNAAYWFMKSLEQRKQTIVRVMECIIEVQGEFFTDGPESLKPLVLRQIAERLDLHESTISRVTSNKYVYTPRGLFELKFFFNSKIQGSEGSDDLAGEAVKMKIKRMITEEDSKKPLSDQKIVTLLAEDGVTIARRTVAKYREAMGIGSSSQRRIHV